MTQNDQQFLVDKQVGKTTVVGEKMSFAVKSDNRYWGPFKTADKAARWAVETLCTGTQWSIVPLEEGK